MKKLTLFWILIFVSQAFTQEKSVALKFDEFSYSLSRYSYYVNNFDYNYNSEKLISLDKRIIRFAQELTKRKDSIAYVIFYNQRKGKYPLIMGEIESQKVVRTLTNQTNRSYYSSYPNPKYPVSPERVRRISGGYRDEPTLEFWIVPQNAEPPKPTPKYNKNEIVFCPDFYVAGDGFRKDRHQPLKFSVAIRDEPPNSKIDLEWNVSAGKITKGQNTNQIEVDLSETDVNFISASVQLKGLHPECDNHKFTSTQVGFYSYKVDEFPQIYYSDLAARFDGLMRYVYDDPNSTGYIIIYGSRNGNKKDVANMNKMIRQAILFLGYDSNKVTIVDGGFRDEMMVEFYLVPQGAALPKPTPTVDSNFITPPKKVVKKRKKSSG